MIIFFKKIVQKLGVDFDIGNTLLLRLWSTVSGALLVLIIPFFLSTPEQGYYFTFASLIGMQIFFELGFNFVITQMISHEMVNVKVTDGKLDGRRNSVDRIYSLIAMLVKWYAVISILFFVTVYYIGIHFFNTHGSLHQSDWVYAWFGIVFCSSLNIFASPFLSVLEGMGFVGRVARLRLYQSIAGYLSLAVLLSFHFKLNAIPAVSGMAALFSLIYIFKIKFSVLFSPVYKADKIDVKNKVSISWRHEIFPFQWRIAISWISGYFIFQLFNPLVFSNQGAAEAGKLGLLLTIFSTILTLSMSWVNAKIPSMSRLISCGNRVELNILFKKIFICSLAFNILLSFMFVVTLKVMMIMGMPLADRVSGVNTVVLIAIINIINHIIFCLASYMRAHKEEPLLFNSVITGVLVAIFAYFMSKYSVFLMISSYLAILITVTLPWVLILFRQYNKRKFIPN
ncbi:MULTISPECIES: hypothetical protein [Cedecea]|jgi:hypothetical protein|uniref:Polysaccharide biosynthesis protein n=1 Tax=Cedecea neteri TaxID=158822 RepID=A0A089Q6N4_9ENTR|nr:MULTISPECIES: hypothetical protein [Cedecea]AIR06916.1 hypothetical protein JT31_20500 [Cedecea neteri]NWC65295.1 hypothetical protein [Cedecea sp. P7760]